MSHTNATQHYNLPQFVGTDTPGWLTDVNQGYSAIDTAIYQRELDIAGNTGSISNIQSDVTGLTNRMSAAEQTITESSTSIDALTTQVTNNTQDIGSLQSAVSSIGSQLAADVWTSLQVTVPAASWVNDRYTVTDAALVTTKQKFLALDPSWLATATTDDVLAITGALIMPISETTGNVTLRAFNGAPESDAHLIIYIADSHY